MSQSFAQGVIHSLLEARTSLLEGIERISINQNGYAYLTRCRATALAFARRFRRDRLGFNGLLISDGHEFYIYENTRGI